MATSAGFGTGILRQGNSLYTVGFRAASMIRLTDRITGNFIGGQFTRVLSDVHEDAAIKIQQGMVDELKGRVQDTRRMQRGTNYLELALNDPRNRAVTASGFKTLLPQWMNQSHASKYWRRIEFGDEQTFNSYILFTNDIAGGKRYGPWSPGGVSGQSQARQARNPNAKTYSRKMPEGYKHMRMPQHAGAYVQNIGPFPEYKYSRGGAKVFDRYQFYSAYKGPLAAIGINLDKQLR